MSAVEQIVNSVQLENAIRYGQLDLGDGSREAIKTASERCGLSTTLLRHLVLCGILRDREKVADAVRAGKVPFG